MRRRRWSDASRPAQVGRALPPANPRSGCPCCASTVSHCPSRPGPRFLDPRSRAGSSFARAHGLDSRDGSNPAGLAPLRRVLAAGIPATFETEPAELAGVYQPKPKRAFDKNLNAESDTFENRVAFLLQVKAPNGVQAGPLPVTVRIRFQTCNDEQCVAGRWSGAVSPVFGPAAGAAALDVPAGYDLAKAPPPASASSPSSALDQGWLAFLLGCVRIRPGVHLHPVRLPDDPHHHVLLPQPAVGRTPRRNHGKPRCSAWASSFCSPGSVCWSRLLSDRSGWRGSARIPG